MNLFTAVLAIAVGSWIAIPNGAWSPTTEQIDEIRSGLKPFIKQQAALQHVKLPAWPSYTFQYQGQANNNKNVVFINAFCEPPPEYAAHEFVLVLDGGPCFFQVKYDPATKKFFDLFFNGEA